VVCGVVVAVASVLVAGALGLLDAVVAAGCAAVTGVTTMPVTAPLTSFFCFVDDVGIG
jgi:hypothetical protein